MNETRKVTSRRFSLSWIDIEQLVHVARGNSHLSSPPLRALDVLKGCLVVNCNSDS